MEMVLAQKRRVYYVRELKQRRDTCSIEVRILSLWRNYKKEYGNTIEMVFVDIEVSNIVTKFFATQNCLLFYFYFTMYSNLQLIHISTSLFCYHVTLII